LTLDASAEQKAAAERYCWKMVALVRARLFNGIDDKEWFKVHRRLVLQGVMEPARYLREREAALPGSRYEQIVTGCVETIEKHGNLRNIRRMGCYFLDVVQKHMRFQGEEYYMEGKTPRGVNLLLNSALLALRPRGQAQDLTKTLAASVSVLRTGGGRKKKADPKQQNLF
jgi:hypothetical protein